MTARRHDLIAVDLDGTLFDPTGRVSDRTRAAVERARREGVEVVICTGRGLAESRHAITSIRADEPAAGREAAPIVVAGGSMICDARSGRTLHRWPMGHDLVRRLCAHFAELRRAPLILKDRDAAGFDYLVVNTGPIEPPSQWWFQHMDVLVKHVAHIDEDPHPEHTVRVGFAATTRVMLELAGSLRPVFGHETTLQHFAAVSGGSGGSGPNGVRDDSVHLIELFDKQVTKWTAVHRLALEQRIPRERVAAIGDEINDLAMIEGAGLGIAMGNAIDAVKSAAGRVTESNREDGCARAIERILDGEW